jgi:1,4-alpha-glucan branching enzyme
MGTEFDQGVEWNSEGVLDWYVLDHPLHQGLQRMVRDLNKLYQSNRALHRFEFDWQGFEWLDCHDTQQSVLCFLRWAEGECLIVVANFTPVPRHGYRIGVPRDTAYEEVFNSDSAYCGGSNVGNGGSPLRADQQPWMDRPWSLELTLPPLGVVILRPYDQVNE